MTNSVRRQRQSIIDFAFAHTTSRICEIFCHPTFQRRTLSWHLASLRWDLVVDRVMICDFGKRKLDEDWYMLVEKEKKRRGRHFYEYLLGPGSLPGAAFQRLFQPPAWWWGVLRRASRSRTQTSVKAESIRSVHRRPCTVGTSRALMAIVLSAATAGSTFLRSFYTWGRHTVAQAPVRVW